MQATILPDVVMPGLVPGIHVFSAVNQEDVDGRDIGERKQRRPSDGYRQAEATPSFGRLCPATTDSAAFSKHPTLRSLKLL
jgi:hypothetical protein